MLCTLGYVYSVLQSEGHEEIKTLSPHPHFYSGMHSYPRDYLYLITYLLTYLLTPWSRVLLEKLASLQLVKKSPAFYGTEGSSPHSQAPATCPCPEPAQSSPHTLIPPPEGPS